MKTTNLEFKKKFAGSENIDELTLFVVYCFDNKKHTLKDLMKKWLLNYESKNDKTK